MILVSLVVYLRIPNGLVGVEFASMGGSSVPFALFCLAVCFNVLLTCSGIGFLLGKTPKWIYIFAALGMIFPAWGFIEKPRSEQRLADAVGSRGRMKEILGDNAGAVREYGKEINKGKTDRVPRGDFYYKLGDYEKAIEDYKHPDQSGQVPYPKLIMSYLKLGKLDDALTACGQYLSSPATGHGPYQCQAQVHFLRQEYEQSLGWYTKLEEKFGQVQEGVPVPALGRAVCYAKMGDQEKALNNYNQAVEIILNSGTKARVEAFVARGDFFYSIDREADGAQDYDQAVALDPRWGRAKIARAVLRIKQGDYESALSDINEVLKRSLSEIIVTMTGPDRYPFNNALIALTEAYVLKQHIAKLGKVGWSPEDERAYTKILNFRKENSSSMDIEGIRGFPALFDSVEQRLRGVAQLG